MSAIRVLLQSARLSIFEPTGLGAADVKAWIANQNYFVDVDLLSGEFSLRASDPGELRRALANDLNRMAAAAFESAAGVASDPVLPRSMAWGSIRSYYAAFFAAHAFLRMYGTACSQLDSEHVNAIYQVAKIFGKTGTLHSLDSGFYSIAIDQNFSNIKFRKLKESHKDTWSVFLALLKEVEAAVPTATALSKHKVEASNLLSNLQDGLTKANCAKGNWLSVMRNSINYRLTHGAWFPHRERGTRLDLLDSASRKWLQEPLPIGGISGSCDLDAFFDVAATTVALLRELVTTGAALIDPPDALFKNGCLKLLNDVKASRKAKEAATNI
jgi:uncharacterized protein (UPF0332 family)